MSVTPVTVAGVTRVAPVEAIPPSEKATTSVPPSAQKSQAPAGQDPSEPGTSLESVQQEASRAGMHFQIQVLPKTDIVITRLVEPVSGRVVWEYPPANLEEALAAAQQQLQQHLDRHA